MDEEAFFLSLRRELQSLRRQLIEDFRATVVPGLDLLKSSGQALTEEEANCCANGTVAKRLPLSKESDPEIADVQGANFDAIHPSAPASDFVGEPPSPGFLPNGIANFQPNQSLCVEHLCKRNSKPNTSPGKADESAAEDEPQGTYFAKVRNKAHALLTFSGGNLLLDEDAAEHLEFLRKIESSMSSNTAAGGASLGGCCSSLRLASAKILFSGCFEGLVFLLILSNSIWLGVQVEFAALHLNVEPPKSYRAVDILFSVLFGLELLLRLFVFRASFCAGRDCWWNLFDMVLVIAQVVEEIVFAFGGGGQFVSSSMGLRLLRLVRAIRVVRILRVLKYLRELRLLLNCIMRSIKAFLWAVVLLGMMNYICSIFVTQIATSAREGGSNGVELLKWHGSVQQSFLSLLQGMLGGCDWGELVQPFLDENMPHVGLLLTAYIAFSILSVMNLVTGTFVDSAIHWANEERKSHTVEHMKHMFKCIDLDTSGEISFEEIKGQLHAKPVQEFFKQIDVHINEAEMLFKVLDGDGTGTLSLEEFVHGCMRLQTPSTALDILLLSQEFRFLMEEIRQQLRLPPSGSSGAVVAR